MEVGNNSAVKTLLTTKSCEHNAVADRVAMVTTVGLEGRYPIFMERTTEIMVITYKQDP